MKTSFFLVLAMLLAGCSPEPSENAEDDPNRIYASDFEPCGADADEKCVSEDGHCICGPGCSEYGPPGFPGRCLRGDFVALCTWTYTCVIPCSVDDDCPVSEMVCEPCPEEIERACFALGGLGEELDQNAGTGMCTYPV